MEKKIMPGVLIIFSVGIFPFYSSFCVICTLVFSISMWSIQFIYIPEIHTRSTKLLSGLEGRGLWLIIHLLNILPHSVSGILRSVLSLLVRQTACIWSTACLYSIVLPLLMMLIGPQSFCRLWFDVLPSDWSA